MGILYRAFVMTLQLYLCFFTMSCRTTCSGLVCSDEHKLVIYQNDQEGIETGPYTVIFLDADTVIIELDFRVGIGYEGDKVVNMDADVRNQFNRLIREFLPPYIDADNRVVVELAQFVREAGSPVYSKTLDRMKIEVYSNTTLLGSQTFQNDYEWYWCESKKCAGDRQNYRTETLLKVDPTPVESENGEQEDGGPPGSGARHLVLR